MIGRANDLLDRAHLAALRTRGVRIGHGAHIGGRPVVSLVPGSSIEIGARFVAQSRSRHQVLGVTHACTIRTVAPGARIVIGDDCGMSGGSIIAAHRIEIGSGVLLGADALIFDTNFHPVRHPARRYAPMPEPRPQDRVMISSNVFIGTGAVILPGTTIEEDCVIGARALIRGVVRRGSVVAGPTAQVVGWTESLDVDG